MTPAARVQTTVEILGRVLAGAPAERELTRWARTSRHAGSGDRRAVRDMLYDCLRRLRSAAWVGGAEGGGPPDPRAVAAGMLHLAGTDPRPLFDGSRHGPAPLTGWAPRDLAEADEGVRLDLPDWLLPRLHASLGPGTGAVARALRDRAPVTLRANLRRTDRDGLAARLAEEGIATRPHPLSPTALVVEGATGALTRGPSFAHGLFELQDAGSQALVDRLPSEGGRILDLCAGGGGKALALAARDPAARILAHDADPARMRDLPARARRAGAALTPVDVPEAHGPFDGVICDVPCSGSGAWRRSPDAKWRLTEARLEGLIATQAAILGRAARLVRPGGWIAYMTCSLLGEENVQAVDRHPLIRQMPQRKGWQCDMRDDGADGFFLSLRALQG
jgi:16S rRNA (cytosine967-C5)-methyltransferase